MDFEQILRVYLAIQEGYPHGIYWRDAPSNQNQSFVPSAPPDPTDTIITLPVMVDDSTPIIVREYIYLLHILT
jgi:hypothetical protein